MILVVSNYLRNTTQTDVLDQNVYYRESAALYPRSQIDFPSCSEAIAALGLAHWCKRRAMNVAWILFALISCMAVNSAVKLEWLAGNQSIP